MNKKSMVSCQLAVINDHWLLIIDHWSLNPYPRKTNKGRGGFSLPFGRPAFAEAASRRQAKVAPTRRQKY
jgi:hypothetical protein